jgi:hypothetical protein
LLFLTLAAYTVAMTTGRGRFGPFNIVLLLLALLCGGLFWKVEAKAASPIIPIGLLRGRRLSARLGINVLVSTVLMGTLVVGPFYLSSALRLTAGAVGLVLSVGPAVTATIGVPAGIVVDRLGARLATLAGLISILVGCSMLSLFQRSFGAAGYIYSLHRCDHRRIRAFPNVE